MPLPLLLIGISAVALFGWRFIARKGKMVDKGY